LASGATFHGKGLDNWRGSLWWWPTKLLTQCKNSASLIGPVHGLHQKSCETGVTSGNVQDALSFEVMRSGVCVYMYGRYSYYTVHCSQWYVLGVTERWVAWYSLVMKMVEVSGWRHGIWKGFYALIKTQQGFSHLDCISVMSTISWLNDSYMNHDVMSKHIVEYRNFDYTHSAVIKIEFVEKKLLKVNRTEQHNTLVANQH